MKGNAISQSDLTESVVMGELDLALVHALQMRPRATWAELAEPLGTTATTLGRRWERLSNAGMAWVAAAPGAEFGRGRCISFVMLRVHPGQREQVVASLAACPEVATIEVATGVHDLNVDILTRDLRELDWFLTQHVYTAPGVKSVSVLLTTSLYLESSRWRLRSLDQEQRNVLSKGTMQHVRGGYAISVDEVDRALLNLLANDGRLSWVELALAAGTSPATCRRRVNRLIASGIVTFRCEIAHSLAGWPVQASLLGQAPASDLDHICHVLAAWAECRFVAAVTGAANVYATFWVQDLGALQRLEANISSALPTLTILDRMVGLNTPKRMGHLCDLEGRRTGTVPISPW